MSSIKVERDKNWITLQQQLKEKRNEPVAAHNSMRPQEHTHGSIKNGISTDSIYKR